MSTETENVDGFLAIMERALVALQEAIRHGLVATNIAKPGPTAIGKGLGLDKSIAWKVGRIAKADSPFDVLEHVPGHQGARIVIEAFTKAGCPKPLIAALTSAFSDLEDAVRTHAGDRATARAMARAALAQDAPAQIDEGQRRDFFRSASQVWGAQAAVQIKTDFIAPGATPGTLDAAGIEGLVDLLRLRPETAWRVARKRITLGPASQGAIFESLDPEAGPSGAPLFARYCTHPRPEITTSEDPDGFTNCELQPGRIGKTGKTTCMLATHCRAAIREKPEDETLDLLSAVHLRTPSELLVLDVFVHKSLQVNRQPEPELYAQIKMGPPFPATGRDHALPTGGRIETLRNHPGSISLLEFPPYASAVTDAIAMAAKVYDPSIWRFEDFQGYRLRISHPPVPTLAAIRLNLTS